ncbi:MAG: hypothetical protein AMJ81_02095 [Phycisphaerae bacterium SM23_33]|nr:MAG: hypothetical protein AMJ81_02095 [Phycisphaerae bacterium SM23_33]
MLAGAPGFGAVPHSPRIDTVSLAADQGWAGDPDIIWYDDFSGSEDLLTRYLDNGGGCTVISYEALGGTGKSVHGLWQVGQVNAGGVRKCFGRCPADYRGCAVRTTEDFRDIYWRHYVKHQPGWIGNPGKMSRATAFAGANWSQAMIAHIWGGYSLNLGISPARGVDANSQVVTTCYNDFPNLTWFGWQQGDYQIFDTAESGRWVCLEGHVRLNTPGLSDGVFTLYIDGQVQAHSPNLNWVYSWQDYGINAVFLENYWNDGSPVEQERYFDDFVISTSYIGLAKSPVRPMVTKTAFRDDDAGDSQSAWQLQVTDEYGSAVLWDSGTILGGGDTVALDADHGLFQGGLAGKTMLEPDTLYALRARQRDGGGSWSDWSPWMTVLRTAAATPGDANCDGSVDGLDYNAWSLHYLQGGNWEFGDFNGDAVVDGLDYNLWSLNYDPAAGAAVPEPATPLLLCAAAMLLGRRRR